MQPNIENFIGCDSSYRAASIVLYGAPYDSTTSYRPSDTKAMVWRPTAPTRMPT